MAGGRAATDSVIPGRCAISVGNPRTALPDGWEWVALSEIAELGTGHTPSRNHPEYWGGDIAWIGIRDAGAHHGGVISNTAQTVTELGLQNSAARLLPKDTVCLSRTASVGYVVKMGRPMATSQDFVTWSCGEALDSDFLINALLAEGDEIRNFGEGSTHTTIYFPEVKAFHITLPPIAEQRRMIAKLKALSARSKRARAELDRIPALVRRTKEAVLQAAFDLPGEEGTASQIVRSIDASKNVRCVERPPNANEIGVVKVSAVTWGKFDPRASKTLPADFKPPAHTRIRAGDLLFSRANTIELVGACVIVEDDPANLYLSDKILRLNVADEHKPWLLWFLRSPSGRSALEAASSGNQHSMRNISQQALLNIQMPLPGPALREAIVSRIESTFTKLDRLAAEARSAAALTAEILRLDNRIVAVRGFEPNLGELLQNYGPAVEGKAAVRGYITTGEDAALLTKRYAMTAERAISREAALRHLEHLNSVDKINLRWTGLPELAEAGGATDVSNCLRWAVHDAMREAPDFAAELRIGQPGNPVPSSQGRLMAALKELDAAREAGTYNGPIVVGKPSPVVRSIGTGLFVLGGAMTIAQLKSAQGDPREGELTGEAVGSLAGSIVVPEVGVALCAILGVATGGLALIPLAICLGIGGAEIGGQIGGSLGSGLDYHPGRRVLPEYWSYPGSQVIHSNRDIARVR